MKLSYLIGIGAMVATTLAAPALSLAQTADHVGTDHIKHVLLLSVDGMHAVDFRDCANGFDTAWADKHPSYSSVGGPGINLNDYYSPEINSTVVPLPGVTTSEGTPAQRSGIRRTPPPGPIASQTSSATIN